MNRHLFILPLGVYRGANLDEIKATVDGLVEMDLFRLPYDRDVFVQITADDCVTYQGESDRMPPGSFVVVGPLGMDQVADLTVHNPHNGFSTSLLHDATMRPDQRVTAGGVIETVRALLIVLLATRNVVKTTKQNKLAKLGIGKRNFRNRFDYTTTISIPADLEDDPDHPGSGIGRVPHLRRGHIRRQHYGPGNHFEKKIWIAPVFVNADPDFVNQRAAYNVAV